MQNVPMTKESLSHTEIVEFDKYKGEENKEEESGGFWNAGRETAVALV